MKKLLSIIIVLTLLVGTIPATVSHAFAGGATTSENNILVSGDYHSLLVKADGSLWAWGNNQLGQLGDGTTISRRTPVKIMDKVVSVTAGAYYSAAVKSDGTLWTWGTNHNGQLGDGTNSKQSTPIKVMDSVVSVASGEEHMLAIKKDGTLWAWGSNYSGEIGDGSKTHKSKPVKIMDDVKAIAAGNGHSLAIKTDGSVWAWGWNSNGQLGDGTQTDRTKPVKVLDKAKSVSAGHYISFAIKTDNTLWAWGLNLMDIMGNGSIMRVTKPTKVMDNVKMAIRGQYPYAIKTDGTLYVWKGSQTGRASTTQVPPTKYLENVHTVAFGWTHELFIKTDGTLWGAGDNMDGQLGTGGSVYEESPVKINMTDILPKTTTPTAPTTPTKPTAPVAPKPTTPTTPYSDWAKNYINDSLKISLVPTTIKDKYRNNITRRDFSELMVTMIEKHKGSVLSFAGIVFTDTRDKNIMKIARTGIVSGKTNQIFDPEGVLSREQLAAIVINTYEYLSPGSTQNLNTKHEFNDSYLVNSWATDYVSKAYALSVLTGYNGNINPKGTVTVEQAITIMKKIYDKYHPETATK